MERPEFSSIVSYRELREHIKKFNESSDDERAALIDDFGKIFLKAAQQGHDKRVSAFVEENFPVNYQDKTNGETALHYAAATDARNVACILIDSGKCDYLIRDNWGRLASEVAYLSGKNPALSRLLGNKERKQAAQQGIKLMRKR